MIKTIEEFTPHLMKGEIMNYHQGEIVIDLSRTFVVTVTLVTFTLHLNNIFSFDSI